MKRLIFLILLIPFICLGNGINKGKYTPPDTILKYADKVLTVGGTYLKYIPKAVSFVPTDIAGCQLWLDAGQGITKDGSDYVSQWNDLSGNSNNALQGTGSAQPLWVDNQLNGEPVVRFLRSGNNYMTVLYDAGLNLTSFSIYFVIKQINYTVDAQVPLSNLAGLNYPTNITGWQFALGQYSTANDIRFTKADGTIGTINPSSNPSSYIIYSAINNDPNATLYENGNSIGTLNKNCSNLGQNNPIGVGCQPYGGGINNFDGDIAEIIIYNSALSDGDRGLVEDYLNDKYAIY